MASPRLRRARKLAALRARRTTETVVVTPPVVEETPKAKVKKKMSKAKK